MGAQLDEINTGVSAIADKKSVVVRLLVDTGASYTFIPLNTLNTLGYDTKKPLRRQAISTGNGQIPVPIVRVAWLNCLGQLLQDFDVFALTTSLSSLGVDGLLGMDFLTRVRAVIDVAKAEIRFKP